MFSFFLLSFKYQDGGLIRDSLVPPPCTVGSGHDPGLEPICELIRAKDGSGVTENIRVEDNTLIFDYVSAYWQVRYVWL